ncbi:hypothetical protein DPEC_G00142000 [Dallia pectoralis]|uniref:Uncharacterized protein n=1 Tax=Dallia pectoralis TaxID=75939 RepID=A0ACC2GMU6_DALPE|nr:hypothetical protein DPEC_G00142000 [Dallia pectoralis]
MGPLSEKTLLVLYLFYAVSALNSETTTPMSLFMNPVTPGFPTPPAHFPDIAKKLMMRCLRLGHRVSKEMNNHFNFTWEQVEGQMSSLYPESNVFHLLLSSLSTEDATVYSDSVMDKCTDTGTDSAPHFLSNGTMNYLESDREWIASERMWNCSSLPHSIKLTRNASAGPRCFMRAFLAPLSWVTLTTDVGVNFSLADYKSLLWAVKPFLLNVPAPPITLPTRIQNTHLEEMMKMLGEVFGCLSEEQRVQIGDWVKVQVTQNNYNCRPKPTQQKPEQDQTKANLAKPTPQPKPLQTSQLEGVIWPSSQPESNMTLMACPSGLVWLKVDVMKMVGPFLSRQHVDDVTTIPKDQLCLFFQSNQFTSSFSGALLAPQANIILQKITECSQKKEDFVQNLDRLGSLACFYSDVQTLNSSMSRRLLSQLNNCSNSEVDKVKKTLAKTVLSSSDEESSPELLRMLGSSVTMMSPSRLSQFSPDSLKGVLVSLGSEVKWSLTQAKALVENVLQGKQELSGNELLSLGSAVRGVASSLLRSVKSKGLLGDERLNTMTQQMTGLQRKALLDALRGDVNASELVQKLPASLLSSLSLTTLDKADLTSFDQLEGKQWTRAQAAFLVGRILGNKMTLTDMRKLGSAMQGVTCQMIEKMAESGVKELAQTVTETTRWLSRTQVCCTAQSLFSGLEKVRKDFFKNITLTELEDIPTMLLVHLPANQIASLPVSVCPVFLEKMRVANLSSLPLSSSSRPALINRTLRCLGRNMSELSCEDVSRLGPLLCELAPGLMSHMASSVLNSTLYSIASCTQIPQYHWRPLLQLLNDTYGYR